MWMMTLMIRIDGGQGVHDHGDAAQGMGKKSANQGCQNMKPVMSSRTRQIPKTQNTSFWPALYLPTSGMLSSWPLSSSGARRVQAVSLFVQKLSRQTWKKRNTKPSTMSTPKKGCRMRVQVPPPNSAVKKKNTGWKNARPDRPAQMKSSATSQWLMRVRSG
jgi:hypothetical protein